MIGHTTRLLVTHSLTFIAQSDLIVVMGEGRVERVGTYEELSGELVCNKGLGRESGRGSKLESALKFRLKFKKELLKLT